MKKYLFVFIAILFISCSSTSVEDPSHIKIIFEDDNYSLYEDDYTNLVIRKEFFSRQYINGDEPFEELVEKNYIEKFLLPMFPIGEYTFKGKAMYQDSIWDISLYFNNTSNKDFENYPPSYICDDIEMHKSIGTDWDNIFINPDGRELYYHVFSNGFSKANCIIRPDGSVAAKINNNQTFTFDENLTEEEKHQIVKCIALYKSLSIINSIQ